MYQRHLSYIYFGGDNYIQFLQEQFLTWKQTVCCNIPCKRYINLQDNHVDTFAKQTYRSQAVLIFQLASIKSEL